jgi:beta-phosphoglucomutase
MDGVIVDSGPAHQKSWQMLGEERGRPVSEDEFAALFGRASRDIILALFGDGFTPEEIAGLDGLKEAIYRDIIRQAVPEMPGAVAAIRALYGDGLRLAIGSSGPPENIDLVLDSLGIRDLFNAVVNGFDVERGKPDPQCFLLAGSRLGLEAARCVVIEDAPAGIEAAHRAGMKAVALCGSHPAEKLRAADAVIFKLAELTPELVRGLLHKNQNL